VIISASRRTDIPALYAEWFVNRVRVGWCQVPNPLNYNQLSYVSLKPEDVDAFVFWSKNPAPMLKHLDELDKRGFRYYFQFTLNDYPKDFEPGLPDIEDRIQTFREIGTRLGAFRVIWRYDPIIISNHTPPDFHRMKFLMLAKALNGLTRRVMVSFVDFYQKTNRRLSSLEELGFKFDREAADSQYAWDLLKDLASIAKDHDMQIFTCAEERNFSKAGVPPGRCIDGELLQGLWSLSGHTKKDPTQRAACLCVVSKDIGMNDTCVQGCPYCYSTGSLPLAERRHSEHDPDSPVLWGNGRSLSEAELADQHKARLL
jgi:hypothetical protein